MLQLFNLANGQMFPTEAVNAPIHVYLNPDADEKKQLMDLYHLDEHTLSSALDPDEVSRLEQTPDYLFLVWKHPANYSGKDSFLFNVESIGFLLLDHRLVIIVTDNLPVNINARQLSELNRPLDVMLGLLLNTIQHYLEHLKVIKMIARDLQGKINTSMANEHLIKMFNLSESLIYYLNAINSNGVVLARLRTHAERAGFADSDLALIDDLVIENNQCYRQAEIYSTVLAGLMDARGSLINNNMGKMLWNLTLINVVFLPLNLLAGIGGMSEFTMMTRGIDWRISYSVFMVSIIFVGWLTSLIIRRINIHSTETSAAKKRVVIKPSPPDEPRPLY